MEPIHLPLTVDSESLQSDAVVIARHVRPEWKNRDISVRAFTDGITNRLVGCFLSDAVDDVVLVRVYGEMTERFIDRKKEKKNMMSMNSRRLAPPLFASFNNGLCYGFTPGKPIDGEMVRDPEISRLIAEMMARMHFVMRSSNSDESVSSLSSDGQETSETPWLMKALELYLSYVPESDEKRILRDGVHIPCKSELKEEVSFLISLLQNLKSPVVFCHNDLLLKNIIYHTKLDPAVTFIDFEYAAYNFQAFDIANHFCEFAGVEVYDPQRYPDAGFQKTWLRNYLLKWKELNNCHESHLAGSKSCDDISALTVTDGEVMQLLNQVEKCSLAAHLIWGIWALIQSQHSKIDFDFLTYASDRIQQYFQEKRKIQQSTHNGH